MEGQEPRKESLNITVDSWNLPIVHNRRDGTCGKGAALVNRRAGLNEHRGGAPRSQEQRSSHKNDESLAGMGQTRGGRTCRVSTDAGDILLEGLHVVG